jgi:type IV pilus assembly protein PilN
VFYQSLGRSDKTIDITGVAESNNRVSSLMRQLDKSDWFESPNLTSVQAAAEFGEQASSFKMTVKVSPPQEKVGDK